MPIDVISNLQPANDNPNFGVALDTDMIGGFQAVADLTARDAIFAGRRLEGMHVYVRDLDTTFRLNGGITNADWFATDEAGLVTKEDLVIPINFDTAGSIDPPAGVSLTSQAQIDDILADAGTSAFKHVHEVLAALPWVLHDVTLNVGAVVQRPSSATAPMIDVRLFIFDGSVVIAGDPDTSNWSVVHAGGTITGHQVIDEVTGIRQPYLDFAALTFPNDNSLSGRHTVTSDGYVGVIWKHTDSRLWLTKAISPAPTDGVSTAFVAKPGTVFRHSTDDLVKSSGNFIKMHIIGYPTDEIPAGLNMVTMRDVTLEDFGSGVACQLAGADQNKQRVEMSNIQLDKTAFSNENGDGFFSQNIRISLLDSSAIATIGTGAADAAGRAESEGDILWRRSYAQGFEDGFRADTDGAVTFLDSVARSCGNSSTEAAIRTRAGGSFNSIDTPGGVINSIVDSPGVALELSGRGRSFTAASPSAGLRFEGNAGSCVQVKDTIFDMSAKSSGFKDGGGNLGVGVEMLGPHGSAILSADTDVTGIVGAIRVAGGVESYATLVANETINDDISFSGISQ